MLNKCVKYNGDSANFQKVKFNLASALELSKMTNFVYNFVKKP